MLIRDLVNSLDSNTQVKFRVYFDGKAFGHPQEFPYLYCTIGRNMDKINEFSGNEVYDTYFEDGIRVIVFKAA